MSLRAPLCLNWEVCDEWDEWDELNRCYPVYPNHPRITVQTLNLCELCGLYVCSCKISNLPVRRFNSALAHDAVAKSFLRQVEFVV